MSDANTNHCGCCAGLDAEIPRRLDNQAGLEAIGYRGGDYSSFKQSLLAGLSAADLPGLAGLSTRDEGDFTVALCDALATTLDVLTFYQERIANENYLRTASERLSILELARLIGYELAPGVAASTWLAFELQETPGLAMAAVAPVRLPKGIQVQSVPGQNQQAQTFETVEEIDARVEWNGLAVQTTRPWRPRSGDTSLWLQGVGVGLQPGDAICIVGQEHRDDPGSERWDIRLVIEVDEDRERQRTRIGWQSRLGSEEPDQDPAAIGAKVYIFRQRASLFGHNAPDPRLLSASGGSQLAALVEGSGVDLVWKDFALSGKQIDLDAAYPKIVPGSWFALASGEEWQSSSGLPGYVELYRAESVSFPSRHDFGLAGRITRLIPAIKPGERAAENIERFRHRLRQTLVLAQTEELEVAETVLNYPLYGASLTLAAITSGIGGGRALAIRGKRACVRLRVGQLERSILLDDGSTDKVAEGDLLRLLAPPEERIGSGWVQLEPATFGDRIAQKSAKTLRLKVLDRGAKAGLITVPATALEMAKAPRDDAEVQEIVVIARLPEAVTSDRYRTTVLLEKATRNCYDRQSVRINANVARATHGQTVNEIVGSGDARVAGGSFALRQPPLTYVGATTPSGRTSTLNLRINDLQWREVGSLYGCQPGDRVYCLRQDDGGNTTVHFGDGNEGTRPPSGDHNIRAVYRKGLGLAGNVDAGTLTTLLTRPLGLAAATNPQAASGGEDAEQEDQARQNAPLTVLTLDRAVSVRDYRDFARAFAGIAKAHALWLASGPGRGLFLTIAGENGAQIPEESTTYGDLQEALWRFGDPLLPIRISSYREARFAVAMAIQVAADADSEVVLAAVGERLRLSFGFAARDFGQTVSVDEVAAVAHAVSGVEAVRITRLQRLAATAAAHVVLDLQPGQGKGLRKISLERLPRRSPRVAPRLFAALPQPSLTELPQAAELLLLDEPLLDLEVLS